MRHIPAPKPAAPESEPIVINEYFASTRSQSLRYVRYKHDDATLTTPQTQTVEIIIVVTAPNGATPTQSLTITSIVQAAQLLQHLLMLQGQGVI